MSDTYPAVTGGIRCPFRLHVTNGDGLPWASHGRTTSVPTSAAILTVLPWPLTPIIFGIAEEENELQLLDFLIIIFLSHQWLKPEQSY